MESNYLRPKYSFMGLLICLVLSLSVMTSCTSKKGKMEGFKAGDAQPPTYARDPRLPSRRPPPTFDDGGNGGGGYVDTSYCTPRGESFVSITGIGSTDRILAVADIDQDGVSEIITQKGIYQQSSPGNYAKMSIPWTLGSVTFFQVTASKYHAYHPLHMSPLVFAGKFFTDSTYLDLIVFRRNNPTEHWSWQVFHYQNGSYSIRKSGSITSLSPEVVPFGAGNIVGGGLDGVMLFYDNEFLLSDFTGGLYPTNVFLMQFLSNGDVQLFQDKHETTVGLGKRVDGVPLIGNFVLTAQPDLDDMAALWRCHSGWAAAPQGEWMPDCAEAGAIEVGKNESGIGSNGPELWMYGFWTPSTQQVDFLKFDWPKNKIIHMLPVNFGRDTDDVIFVFPNAEGTGDTFNAYACAGLSTGGGGFDISCESGDIIRFNKGINSRFFSGDSRLFIEFVTTTGSTSFGYINFRCRSEAVTP